MVVAVDFRVAVFFIILHARSAPELEVDLRDVFYRHLGRVVHNIPAEVRVCK